MSLVCDGAHRCSVSSTIIATPTTDSNMTTAVKKSSNKKVRVKAR